MGYKAILAGVTIVIYATSAANAADMYGKGPGSLMDPPYVEAAWNWAGAYGGINTGYGSGSSTHYLDRDGHGSSSNDPDGGIIGLTIGYNYQLTPQWVAGVEADLSYADIAGEDNKRIYDGHYWGTGWNAFASLRGRLGYAFGRTLVYGTAGLAGIESAEFIQGNTANESTDGRGWRSGWVAGAGVEHMFTDRISGKIEYLHAGFEDVTGFDRNGEAYRYTSDLNLVRAGLNYKIN